MLDEYDYRFELGKAAELRTGRDVVLISTGLMTMRALQAAARLEADHVDVAVLHVPTIKPLDRDAILRAARTDRLVVTLENHTVVGGLSEAVAVDRSPSPASGRGSCRSRCPTSSSPPAPCPPCTTATGCPPTRSSAGSRPSSTATLTVRSTPPRPPSDPFRREPCPSRIRPPSSPAPVPSAASAAPPRTPSPPPAGTSPILDLDEAGAKDAANEVAERHGRHAVGVGCDITDAASVEAALGVVDDAVPPVGALVNNAGITSPTPFLEVTGEEWERIFAVNVRGSYNVTRQLAPGMVERGFGRIVFLSSVSAERGGGVFGGVAYSAAKAGQLGFARALARELGPRGVTVNSVAPGLIDTDITAGKLVGEKEKQVLAGVPVGRKGRASDVADLITYLCREESGYITGATYDVNGGAHIH